MRFHDFFRYLDGTIRLSLAQDLVNGPDRQIGIHTYTAYICLLQCENALIFRRNHDIAIETVIINANICFFTRIIILLS